MYIEITTIFTLVCLIVFAFWLVIKSQKDTSEEKSILGKEVRDLQENLQEKERTERKKIYEYNQEIEELKKQLRTYSGEKILCEGLTEKELSYLYAFQSKEPYKSELEKLKEELSIPEISSLEATNRVKNLLAKYIEENKSIKNFVDEVFDYSKEIGF